MGKRGPQPGARLFVAKMRLIDMAAFHRCKALGMGVKLIAQSLGCAQTQSYQLLHGMHWQQNPERVVLFNEVRGANVDVTTGVPTAADLAKFGYGPGDEGAALGRAQAVAGGAGRHAKRVGQRIQAAGGGSAPAHLDTAVYLRQIEEALHHALAQLTAGRIAEFANRDLSTLISMLAEKRQLLKGEPTVITRSETRGDLARVSALLLEEAKRRGITLEGQIKAVTVQ